jgi:hypothetical protein
MRRRKNIIERLSSAVDRGTSSAEKIHREVAGMPLEFFARADILKEPAGELRAAQDRTIESIYELVRRINHRLTDSIVSIRTGRSKATKRPRSASPRKRKTAAKKPRKSAARSSVKNA